MTCTCTQDAETQFIESFECLCSLLSLCTCTGTSASYELELFQAYSSWLNTCGCVIAQNDIEYEFIANANALEKNITLTNGLIVHQNETLVGFLFHTMDENVLQVIHENIVFRHVMDDEYEGQFIVPLQRNDPAFDLPFNLSSANKEITLLLAPQGIPIPVDELVYEASSYQDGY